MPKESRKSTSTPVTPYSGGGSRVCRKKFSCPVCSNCSVDWYEFSKNYDELMKQAKNEIPASRPRNEEVVDQFDEIDDFDDFDEFDDLGDEDAYEGAASSLKPGETFEDHIHFGDPDDEVWDEGWSVSNGIVSYWRTTSSGRTYHYRGLVGQTDIGRLRAL